MTSSEPTETVVLRGGAAVALSALRLAWALEDRGLTLRLAEDGRLLIGPRRLLTGADRDAIRDHREMLVAIVRHSDQAEPLC